MQGQQGRMLCSSKLVCPISVLIALNPGMLWHVTKAVWKRLRSVGPCCRQPIPVTSLADGQSVGGYTQKKPHNNVSKETRKQSWEQQNWLQLYYAKLQTLTSQCSKDSRQLTDAVYWHRRQIVPVEKMTCFFVSSGSKELFSKQELSDYGTPWGWQLKRWNQNEYTVTITFLQN